MTKEDHTPEETDFIKWGLLYKRRNGMGKWTREPWQYRFFTLTVDGVLNYYDMGNDPIGSNSEESRPRGQLALGYMNYTLVREPSIDGAPSKFAIQIQPENGESWNMCADTEADHGQWCLELEHFLHVDSSKKGRRDSQLSSYDNDGDLATARSKAKDESSPAKGGNPTSKLPGKNGGDAHTAGGKSAPTKSGKSGSFLKMNKKHNKGKRKRKNSSSSNSQRHSLRVEAEERERARTNSAERRRGESEQSDCALSCMALAPSTPSSSSSVP